MTHPIVFALDFDGVICDSAVETGMTGWKAAGHIWNDIGNTPPPATLIERFRAIRPVIETGYETILAIRLLSDGCTVEQLLDRFTPLKEGTLNDIDHDIDSLKQLFGTTRDDWIERDRAQWIGMNPLFPGIAERLTVLTQRHIWYIITTKQERFVRQILGANGISLPETQIFGLDRNMSKQAVLYDLLERHPDTVIRFVEDRLQTLLGILRNDRLRAVQLRLADWGYNTESDRYDALRHGIELLDLDHFPG